MAGSDPIPSRLIRDLSSLPDAPLGPHLTESELEDFARDRLEREALERARRHLESCDACLDVVGRCFDRAGAQDRAAAGADRMLDPIPLGPSAAATCGEAFAFHLRHDQSGREVRVVLQRNHDHSMTWRFSSNDLELDGRTLQPTAEALAVRPVLRRCGDGQVGAEVHVSAAARNGLPPGAVLPPPYFTLAPGTSRCDRPARAFASQLPSEASNLQALLRLPDAWADRLLAWERITRGPTLYEELEAAGTDTDWSCLLDELEAWRRFFAMQTDARAQAARSSELRVAQAMTWCAARARLEPDEDHAMDDLPAELAGNPELIRGWFQTFRPGDRPYQVRVPVVLVDEGTGRGRVATLQLEVLCGPCDAVFRHPIDAFTDAPIHSSSAPPRLPHPCPSFAAALRDAWDAASSATRRSRSDTGPNRGRWRLLTTEDEPIQVVHGGSVGGAAMRGWFHALNGTVADPRVVVLASIGSDGRLSGVDSVRAKTHAVAGSKVADTIVVATKRNGVEVRGALKGRRDPARGASIRVRCIRAAAALVEVRSVLADALIRYLDRIAGHLSEESKCPPDILDELRMTRAAVVESERRLDETTVPVLVDLSKLASGPVLPRPAEALLRFSEESLRVPSPLLAWLRHRMEGPFCRLILIRGTGEVDKPGRARLVDLLSAMRTQGWQTAIVVLRNGRTERSGPLGVAAARRLVHAWFGPGPDRVSIGRLPLTGDCFVGRDEELQRLDKALQDEGTRLMTIVAWGGVGKSALVNEWMRGVEEDNYRGVERVFGWTFYRHATSPEGGVSADAFIDAALRFFGDSEPTAGSPWDRGERLAELVRRRRTLLVLDGLEALQHSPASGQEGGFLKDPAMQALLRGLAAKSRGLCVITSRYPLKDLASRFGSTVLLLKLDHLSKAVGARLLASLGVHGDADELRAASAEVDGHALSLLLLGKYLTIELDGDVKRRHEVRFEHADAFQDRHAWRIMRAYEERLDSSELCLLRLLALVDRPTRKQELEALLVPPAIESLTEPLSTPIGTDWDRVDRAIRSLQSRGLLSHQESESTGWTIDAHPLVREFFGSQVRVGLPEAWRRGHDRLYEHLKGVARRYPKTLEEMLLLYDAVLHGCRAGRHQEVFDEVYRRRILREHEYYSNYQLGLISSELVNITHFFDKPYFQPVAGLDDRTAAFVFKQAGYCLRAHGKLQRAAQCFQASRAILETIEDWDEAATLAGLLSQLLLDRGSLREALGAARQANWFAERIPDRRRRLFQCAVSLSHVGTALHRLGDFDQARNAFRHAERMQRARQPSYPLLHGGNGFRYGELLLAMGLPDRVHERLLRTRHWRTSQHSNLFSIAQQSLLLGRTTHCLGEDVDQAAAHLDEAVQGFRRAGREDFLPRTLCARASLHRARGTYEPALEDLDEALAIAVRGQMQLHAADIFLERARLWRQRGDEHRALEDLARAKGLVRRLGYQGAERELRELELWSGERGR